MKHVAALVEEPHICASGTAGGAQATSARAASADASATVAGNFIEIPVCSTAVRCAAECTRRVGNRAPEADAVFTVSGSH